MVYEISAIAGYHVSSIKTIEHDTNYKEKAELYVISFRTEQKINKLWKMCIRDSPTTVPGNPSGSPRLRDT